jgi:Tfp pilus assembly protein PilF
MLGGSQLGERCCWAASSSARARATVATRDRPSRRRPQLPSLLRPLQFAVLERRRGNYAAAARAFQRGTACAPRNPHIWYSWAHMTRREVGDHRAARRLYERATQLCPR